MKRTIAVVPFVLSVLLSTHVDAVALSNRTLLRLTDEGGGSFAYSVSGVGDVNGDGYGDALVGAPDQNGTGSAFLYFLGPTGDDVPDLILEGISPASGDNFGISVSGAGDMNGDGYADVIVGAHQKDFAGLDAGEAYVYFGGPNPSASGALILSDGIAGDRFGSSVSGAGDVNGDGYDDVIVGAPGNDFAGTDAGAAFVYFGGAAPDSFADAQLSEGAAGYSFGASVSGARDVNQDGFDDVIVGAPGANSSTGMAYVYFSGVNLGLFVAGGSAGDNFGSSVSMAGDVNGDGYDDVIVGAYNASGFFPPGAAYVYFGAQAPDNTADLVLGGTFVLDRFGGAVSSAGDVNGDGFGDFAVGASGAGGNLGRAYVYFGGSSPNASADVTFTGTQLFGGFGSSLSDVGDVNGDGRDDLFVGAAGAFAQVATLHSIFPFEILAPNGGEDWVAGQPVRVRWLGRDVADLALSYDGGATWESRAVGLGGLDENEYLLTAPTVPTQGAKVRLSFTGEAPTRANSDESDGVFEIRLEAFTPPAAASRRSLSLPGGSDGFGSAASGAGDVNGDGLSDWIVGAYANDAGGSDAGRAYVYFGGSSADGTPDLTLTGSAAADSFGYSVAGAGDVNGDGYDDLVVGAPGNDAGGSGAGSMYVYFGGFAPDAVSDLVLSGSSAGDNLGFSVAGAGDLNRDGYDDLLVGAPYNDFAGTDAGRAYVLLGGAIPNSSVDLELEGEFPAVQFGFSVSGAGDMNGDGFAEFLVGEPNDGPGSVYFYHGAGALSVRAGRRVDGEVTGERFGSALGAIGDVNGDGYADVAIGAPSSDAGGANAGRMYVFLGARSESTLPDLVLTGTTAGDQLGASISGGGDLNHDGCPDVIVGLPASGSRPGSVSVHFGCGLLDAVADWTLSGQAASDLFGATVASVGDVNGDGFADALVGARSGAGRAEIHEFNRYVVTAPNGGESWPVGSARTISWLGAEPADLWLSLDGGKTYDLIESGVGGAASNALDVRVPHAPTKFARIRVTPSDAPTSGSDRSDSLFTIQTSVALLALLAAPLPQGGVELTWSTDPGPEDLRGYRIERGRLGSDWQTLAPRVSETRYVDNAGGPGDRYRLFAVNGFGEEVLLGETSLRPLAPLAAWPMPYRGGPLSISFATAGGLGGGTAPAEVSLFDVRGRLVRRIARGSFMAGYQSASWDGRDERGARVGAGVYFLRSTNGREDRRIKLVVMR